MILACTPVMSSYHAASRISTQPQRSITLGEWDVTMTHLGLLQQHLPLLLQLPAAWPDYRHLHL